MNVYGLPVGCVRCGGDTRIDRHGVTLPHRVVAVVACVDCGADHCLRVELTPITPPPPPVDERARAYRARKAMARADDERVRAYEARKAGTMARARA